MASVLLRAYGWDDHWRARYDDFLVSAAASEIEDPEVGRVVRHDGAGLMVATADGPPRRAMFGPSVVPAPVVGDWVVLDRHDTPRATLPRDSLLRRRAAGGEGEQALVANLDVVLIVCGLDRPVRLGRIQRTVTLANDAGADSVVVLTKADRAAAEAVTAARATVAEVDPSLPVLLVSATSGAGIDDLATHVGDRTVALIGESGAGKSTLVNRLVAEEVAEEGAVRAGDSKGRHTTTSRELHLLAGGGVLVDTPGIREVGVFAEQEAVAETFPDIDELVLQCRFNDCAHLSEPGCAVSAAVADGDLDEGRLARWRALRAEVEAAEARSDPAAGRRRAQQRSRTPREGSRRDQLRSELDRDEM